MTNRVEWIVEFVVRLGVGSTLLLVAGLLAMAICRRHSAATLYWIGTWTGIALLLLPLAAAVLPSWQLGWLDSGQLKYQFETPFQQSEQADVVDAAIATFEGVADDPLDSQPSVSRRDKPTTTSDSNTPLGRSTHGADVDDQPPQEEPSA